MTATITIVGGATVATPLLVVVDSLKTRRASNNKVHQLLSGGVALTIRAAAPRTGELVLLYSSKSAAESARDSFAQPAVFTYVDDAPTESLTFVVTDQVSCEIEPETKARWIVTVPYQSVT